LSKAETASRAASPRLLGWGLGWMRKSLYLESWRSGWAMFAAAAVGVGASRFLPVDGPNEGVLITATALLTGWSAFSMVHAGLIWLGYRKLSGEKLREAILSDRKSLYPRRSGLSEALTGTSTASLASRVVSMALVGVMVLAIYPELRTQVALLGLGAGLVLVAWLDLALSHAVQYARTDLTQGGLRFPGDAASSFADYQYFATGVQSTFGTTDVEVTTTTMRTTVRFHGLMAFAFNSVIVAMLVSLVLGVS